MKDFQPKSTRQSGFGRRLSIGLLDGFFSGAGSVVYLTYMVNSPLSDLFTAAAMLAAS